ncbi:MAG: hypothetical protein H6Q90_1498 [Deltaproteobacteria bacterium]|nr:hypothetical protein [Deltaproteobacteria bacterium]
MSLTGSTNRGLFLFVLGASLLPMGAWAETPATTDEAPPVQTLNEPTAANLQVNQLPPKLKMRPRKQVAQTATPAPAPDAAATTGGGSVGYKWFPTSRRDLAERVTFRIRAGVQLDSTPASGDTLRGGQQLPPGFTETRPWIVGDAMVGARGIIMPSLGGYLLSSFQFDANDSLATRAGTVSWSDANGEQIAIKAGYAEWGRDDRKPDDQQPHKVWLRGGRQFRLDGGNLFAYFDGITAGYKERSWNASAFVGRRVVLYVDSEAGLTYGATAAIDLKPSKNIPVKLAMDFMGLTINNGAADENRQLIALMSTAKLSKKAKLDVRARITGLPDNANLDAMGNAPTKLALGRVGGRLRYETGNLIATADFEQRFADDVAYDLAAPTAADIVQVGQQLGVGLNQPVDALAVGARVDWQNAKKDTELLVFEYTDEGAGTDGMRTDGLGSFFGNSASSGLDRMQQVAVEGTMATPSKAGKRWRFAAGGFFRVYDFRTPYRAVTNDARGGGRAELQWWFRRDLHLDVAGEVAQASPTLSRDLGVLSSVRAAVEARW